MLQQSPLLTYQAVENGISNTIKEEQVPSSSSDDDRSDGLSSSDDEEDESRSRRRSDYTIITWMWKLLDGMKEVARVVANVDDLWDSPDGTTTTTASRRRNKSLVLFWFVVAASSYAGERSTFKLLIDRVSCYRLVAVQIVCFLHAVISCCITNFRHALGIPMVDVALMAVMDTITMIGLFVAGAKVPPTLTVILVQATIPLAAFLSPQRGLLTRSHVTGCCILLLAVALALVPAILSLVQPDLFLYADAIPIRTAVNTLLYAGTSLCGAASQLYKESVFLQHKQPVNMEYLNLLLSVFQFILASIVSPLAYVMQGLGARGQNWTHEYPVTEFGDNFMDGLNCILLFFHTTTTTRHDYPDTPACAGAWSLAILHVLTTLSVAVAVDKITNAGATKVMYRGISAGIIVAALSMHLYDMHTPVFNYGPAVDALNLLCLLLLILGSEVYHRSALPESTFDTVHAPVELP